MKTEKPQKQGPRSLLSSCFAMCTFIIWNTVTHADANNNIILVNSLSDEVSITNGKTSLRAAINFANQHPDKNLTILMRPGIYHLTRTGSDENFNQIGDLDITDRTGTLTILPPPERAVHNNHDQHTGNNEDFNQIDDQHTGNNEDFNQIGDQHTGNNEDFNQIGDHHTRRGPNKPLVTIDATGLGDRVLEVFGGNVTLIGLKLTGGSQVSDGGAIANRGNLTIKDTIISKNSADFGAGGILSDDFLNPNPPGTLKVINSIITNNTAGVLGGGIESTNILLVHDSIISQNSTGDRGAGGLFIGGTAEIINTTISNNFIVQPTGVQFYGGGGIHLGEAGNLSLKYSTVSNNSSVSAGGGIFTYGGTMKIVNSNIDSNQAKHDDGGGIYVNPRFGPGILDITNSRIRNNTAANNGGGIYSSGTLTVTDSIIAKNIADSDNNGTGDGGGIFNAGSLTLEGKNTIVNNQPDNIVN
ncbi:MAG: hypothetical protein ACXV8O_05845 [Methylobacter sp.]